MSAMSNEKIKGKITEIYTVYNTFGSFLLVSEQHGIASFSITLIGSIGRVQS